MSRFFSLQFLLIFFLSVLLVLWYRKLHWFHAYRFSNIIIISYRCQASEHDMMACVKACWPPAYRICFCFVLYVCLLLAN